MPDYVGYEAVQPYFDLVRGSIIRIQDRKIVRWRDYLDSLAAWSALTAASH